MYDDILLPTDGSKGTLETIEHAISIARDNDATLHILYAVDRRMYLAASKDTKEDVRRSMEEQGEVALDDARTRAEETGLDVVTDMREGIPHKTILEYVEDAGIDMVTMGTHGKTGRDRMATLGSVTERVVQNSPVPVLVVNIGE
ncbi:universal stress protein [Haloarculaceae archaeon H-GB2-1]|nr:universal stress protein [Haloarculaceae archaeon H-GB1-1]MEA5386139.1 universal stress protein [Haloarculaceae archaeon H-GB11]MEA5407645.1 universal stress protein [Haloarculaceae archaeon H-GB2-1]